MAPQSRVPQRLGGNRPRPARGRGAGRADVGPPPAGLGAAAGLGSRVPGGGVLSREATPPSFHACPFFVVRTPLLPFDELLAWSAGAESPGDAADAETLAADR